MNILLLANSSFFSPVQRYTFDCYYSFIIKVTREQKEALSQRIANFYCHAANRSVKMAVNYFKKQNIPQSNVYYLLKKI